MTLEEKLNLSVRSIELKRAGKLEEAEELFKQIPLAPYLAKAAKEVYGAEYLLNNGYNLSEAEAEYGKDWLR
jgi:hypothetical protein